MKDITKLVPVCNLKMQTMAILGDGKRLLSLIWSGVKGIDRVVQVGKRMEFSFVWDRYDLRERLTREVIIF